MAAAAKSLTKAAKSTRRLNQHAYEHLTRGYLDNSLPVTHRTNSVEAVHYDGNGFASELSLVLQHDGDVEAAGYPAAFRLIFRRKRKGEPFEDTPVDVNTPADLATIARLLPAVFERAVEEKLLPSDFPIAGGRV